MLPRSLVNVVIISPVGKKASEVWWLHLHIPQFLIFCLLGGLQESEGCHRSPRPLRQGFAFTTPLGLSSHYAQPQGPLPGHSSPVPSAKIKREDSSDVPGRTVGSVSESRARSEPEVLIPFPCVDFPSFLEDNGRRRREAIFISFLYHSIFYTEGFDTHLMFIILKQSWSSLFYRQEYWGFKKFSDFCRSLRGLRSAGLWSPYSFISYTLGNYGKSKFEKNLGGQLLQMVNFSDK